MSRNDVSAGASTPSEGVSGESSTGGPMANADSRETGRAGQDARRHDRYLIREGQVFGGVTAALLMRWSPWAFVGWFVLAFALWLYDLLRHP